MNQIEIAQNIAQFHNILTEISVKGEDVFRMREVLVGMRNLTAYLTKENDSQSEGEEKE